MAYPTTAELVAASTVAELTSLTEEQQDALRSSAISAIEDWCGQSFLPEDDATKIVRSEGGAELYLPKRLRSLTSMQTSGGAEHELAAVHVADEGDMLLFKSGVVGVGYYEQALFEVSGGDYPQGFKKDLLTITGDWGWETVPEPVVTAIRFDMEDAAVADANALSSTVHAFRALGLTNISQGNLRADLGTIPVLSVRVTRLLSPYLFLGRGGRLV
jgi:hypothetical protein